MRTEALLEEYFLQQGGDYPSLRSIVIKDELAKRKAYDWNANILDTDVPSYRRQLARDIEDVLSEIGSYIGKM